MEVKSINYFGNDGWENCTDYNYTPSSELHIPRIGDTILNKSGNRYIVIEVVWNLHTNSITIYCNKLTEKKEENKSPEIENYNESQVKKYAWWTDKPYHDTFNSVEEAIEDAKSHRKDFKGNVIFFGEVEEFNYSNAAEDCLDTMKDRFDEIYDDWQSNLDDDQVWYSEKEEEEKKIKEHIRSYFIRNTDFSIKQKAWTLGKFDLDKNEYVD